MTQLIAGAIALAAVAAAGAQQPTQNTEIYVIGIRLDPAGLVSEVTNISNSPGYDNQPGFLPDGSGVLFTSDRGGQQTDIYRYDFATKAVTQVTRTPEREYSPTVTPDRRTFSVVRVEADGTQRLWRFDLDGSNARLVLERVKPVGYHVWIDETHLALFVLGAAGQPSTLQVADTTTGEAVTIESNIGRSLLVRPGRGTVSFVSQPQNARRVVKELDPRTRQVTTIVEAPADDSQDAAWLPDGTLLMSTGTKIFGWNSTTGWREIADLSAQGLARLTRLAVGRPFSAIDQPAITYLAIAVVAEPAR